MQKYIKPSEYARITGLNYRTGIKHFYKGYIDGYKDENTGSLYLLNPNWTEKEERHHIPNTKRVVLYARISSSTNKNSLDGQIERMRMYAIAKGYQIVYEEKEIASGLNDNRKKLNKILEANDWDILLVEHKDRLTRFGFNYFNFLKKNNQCVEVINQASDNNEDLMNDLIAIITSFCGRIYGRNRKKKTQEIIEEVNKLKDET